MATTSTYDVTELLLAWCAGDESALESLIPLVHRELHHLAKRYMRRERAGHTLQTTALVNEAYLRLIDCNHVQWQNRVHFFAVAARVMRQILVDYARERRSSKRGGQEIQIALDDAAEIPQARRVDLIALDEALQSLAQIDQRKSQVVELRFFVGLTIKEIAEVFKVSTRTVSREWELAQAWLYREMSNR
ncbi:MAG TPA: sigma-70 family RNA polymerase sigma factor [Blastocatellia bacterium]|nr:sigma-70 family RNA polymerase sigma factor [Blastocatellia bacterium]